MKIFKGAINHDNHRCDVCHIDTDCFDNIPDELKVKAHAICLYKGKMVIVNHPEWNIWGIPGGTRELGESIEETLKREILEEANCEMIDCRPIAYQKVINPDGSDAYYRLQYICNVEHIGEFKSDIGGNIDKICWINPMDFEQYIENKEFKKAVIRRALEILDIL